MLKSRNRHALRRIKRLSGVDTILDVGCGSGDLVDLLNRRGYEADGIDTSKEVVDYAKNTRKGDFYHGDAENIKRALSNRKYDLVVACQLIEHLNDPLHFLLGVHEIMTNRGYLYLETPNLKAWRPRSVWRSRIGGMYGEDHRFAFTTEALLNLLGLAGYDIKLMETRTYPPTIMKELICQVINKSQKQGKTSSNQRLSIMEEENIIGKVAKRQIKNILKKLYEHILESGLTSVILYIPNKLSERRGRGNHIIVIARKRI